MAVDYSEWPIKRLSVTALKLDPLNPRLPGAGEDLEQRDIIEDLVRNDDVYSLARSIAEKGYFPTDSLLAVKDVDSNRYYIVEGNRRLAALKILLSPRAAPKDLKNKFAVLSQKIDRNMITKVRVTVAPSRDDAIPVIVDRHTQSQIERWSPAMQARFFGRMYETGHAVREIAEASGLTEGRIRESLRNDIIYRAASSLGLPEEIQAKVGNPRAFPLSTLERILEMKPAQDFLGLTPHPEKIFEIRASKSEFLRGFRRLVSDVAQKKVDSRTANKAEAVEEYFSRYGEDTPVISGEESISIEDLLVSEYPSDPKEEEISSQPRGPASESWRMVRGNMKCTVDSARIKSVLEELRKLSLKSYPNACAVLFGASPLCVESALLAM